jgi:hypothetical protein
VLSFLFFLSLFCINTDRARLVLAELDKAANNSNGLMASAVLHGYEQKYPTNVLRVELERELDEMLRKQVRILFATLTCSWVSCCSFAFWCLHHASMA